MQRDYSNMEHGSHSASLKAFFVPGIKHVCFFWSFGQVVSIDLFLESTWSLEIAVLGTSTFYLGVFI